MGDGVPKQYRTIRGVPVLAWAVAAFQRAGCVDEVILVVPEDDLAYVAEGIVDFYAFSKVRRIVPGGKTRQDSTLAGIAVIETPDAVVLVHDGVRPLVTVQMIEATCEAAREHGAAIIAVPVVDTIKRVDNAGRITETVSRESLWAAQTPQGFRLPLLLEAINSAREAGFVGTDEAMLVERMGLPVHIVAGAAHNLKITRPEDLERAEHIAAGMEMPC
jgi:2-C-methyl-D-erythritol 4-phosphate cytidylyltransferase